jgi:Fic family protein
MVDDMENYISEIKQILAKAGWSQARLAQEMGVTFATVNRWLNGHAQPHPVHLRQISKLFRNIVGIIPLSQKDIQLILEKVIVQKEKMGNITRHLRKEGVIETFLLELTYNSDAIEGSTLTKKETEAVIFDRAIIKDRSLIEHLEATNHASILEDIFSGGYNQPITEDLIKEIHKFLMQGIRDDAGEYAKYQRGIRGVDLILPHPADIPEEMGLFCAKVNCYDEHPVEHIAKMHADFEAIHPFGDGNGRVGRLIMCIQAINEGFPPPIITVEDKAKYYEVLEYAQKNSETHFIYFLAQAILRGYEILKKYEDKG